MPDKTSYALRDYDSERSNTTINIVDITSANIDAQKTLLATLRVAMETVMLQGFSSVDIQDGIYDATPVVTDPFSQREIKWAFIVQDALGNKYKANEVPCANLAILENGSKYIYKNQAVTVVTAAADVTALVAAYEAVARDKSGNVVTVIDIFQVGRNI